jgi:hypothetical protein
VATDSMKLGGAGAAVRARLIGLRRAPVETEK